MRITNILRIVGILLILFSFSMLTPVAVELWYGDGGLLAFIYAFLLTIITGFILWGLFRTHKYELKPRDGFLVVVLFWVVLSFFGAIPLMIATHPHLSLIDAAFEAVSGLTTTGATVLSGIDKLPHSVLYYRQQLQFLGGMGIVVLAVAVLPMLGVGGMQLYRAETPGPMKESKLTPRLTETAKSLWYIYVGLVVACILAYWLAGMNLFDAVGEAFGTVSTGGFSMHDNSFGFYHNDTINLIGVVFMLLGGTNFGLHFMLLQNRSLSVYWQDLEFKAYLIYILAFVLIIGAVLHVHHVYASTTQGYLESLFNVVSIATTTGFVADPFSAWPTFIPILILLAGIIGGCAASTSGGLKVIRALLLYKQTNREINRLIHPKAIVPIKFGKQLLPDQVMQAMWGFIAAFFVLFVVLILAMLATGAEFDTAFAAVCATITNAGAGIAGVAENFASLSPVAKGLGIFGMLAGRLEIFTILVLLSPGYWYR